MVYSESVDIEGLLTKIERNNETLIFLKILPWPFKTLIPGSFLLVKAPQIFLFSYTVKLCSHISFNAVHILKPYP